MEIYTLNPLHTISHSTSKQWSGTQLRSALLKTTKKGPRLNQTDQQLFLKKIMFYLTMKQENNEEH